MNKINRSLFRAFRSIDDDLEEALQHISIAVDALSKEKYPHLAKNGKVGQRIKKFIGDNEGFIMRLCMPNVQAISFMYSIRGTNYPLSQVFYKLIRSSLLHGDGFEKHLVFDSGAALGVSKKGKFIVSYAMVNAFALAILTDPKNSDGEFSEPVSIYYGVKENPDIIQLDTYFGKQVELLQRLGLSTSFL
ncbi:hypothetical protein [Microbulbifer sp. MCCC 1A16149]|uniref:hypothetical protein n=1 Tax=Microbulbifer sp. MCCC 1A16149 TaxID=3411322 RepID=UPI003D12F97C